MRIRALEPWVWVVLLMGTIIFGPVFLSGCATQERVDQARQNRELANSEYKYAAVYLGQPSIYLIKFEGHEYLTHGSNSPLLHTVSCKGVHDE